jgi:HK97 family phage prohead protease
VETAGERALAITLALEEGSAELLDCAMVITLAIEKDATRDDSFAPIAIAFAEAVVALRSNVRCAAAGAASAEIAELVAPSGTDDTERGDKAAAYYVKALAAAIPEGEMSKTTALEAAYAASREALLDVACFETFDAWNDETVRAATTLQKAGKEAVARWKTKRDGNVCPRCEGLDKKAANKDGKFRDPDRNRLVGPPPLHHYCRCVVAVERGKALEEEEEPMLTADEEKRALLAPEEKSLGMIAQALHFKAIDEKTRTVDFVASTDVVDAHEEIVDQGSWDLADYLKNPVVLFAHDSRELPIGKAVAVGVYNSGGRMQLEARIEFASAELNPKAEQVFQMLKAKFLRAVSVGFVPKSFRWELRDGAEVGVWGGCVLKEISVTPVPANPEALAKMKSLAVCVANQHVHAYGAPAHNTKTITPPAVSESKNQGAPPRKEETMNEKDLQDKVEKQAAAIATLESEAKVVTLRVTTAEKHVAALEANVKSLETDKLALDAQTKTLAADRDAEKARADKAEGQLIETEVEQLVGKKITPAEKPMFVELRKSNAKLFTDMIAQRADMKLLEVVTEKGAIVNGVGNSDLLAELKSV